MDSKSSLVTDLAMAVATGGQWLDCFQCERGEVLIIDNELHEQASAHRNPKVLDARGIAISSVADRVSIINIRGGLKDIFSMNETFASLRGVDLVPTRSVSEGKALKTRAR